MVKDDLWSDPEDVVYDDKVSTGLVKQKVNTPANYAPNSKFNNVAGSKKSTPNVSLSTEQTKIYSRHENRLPEPNYFNSSQLNLDTTSFDNIASKNTQTNITSSSTFDPSSVSTVLIPSSITREDLWRSYSEKSIVLEPFTRIEESVTLVPNAGIPDTNPDMQASSFTNDHVGSTLEIEEELWVTPDEHQNRDEELLLDSPDDVEMLFLLDVKNNTQTSFASDFEDTPSTFRDFEETSSLREFENALESDPLLYSLQLLDIEAELAELERIETELATQQFKTEHSTVVIGRRGMVQAPGWMGSSSVLHINWENEEEAKQEALERLGYSKLNISEATRNFVIQAARACRLTHQEELALTTRLEQARSHLNQLPDLDVYETKRSELQAEIAGLERTLVYNLQWVAVKKAPQFLGLGIELDDLIQYGILGIFAGIRHFDIKRKARLLVVVNWWVFQALARAVTDYGRLIRLPVHIREPLIKIKKRRTKLEVYLGRLPSHAELAEDVQMSLKHLEELLSVDYKVISLNFCIRAEHVNDGYSFQPVEEALVVEEGIANNGIDEVSIKQEVDAMLDCLKPRERTVIELRYDLDDQKGEMRTLEEVGKVMHVTRERIRQIEERSLKKIRQSVSK